MKTMFYLISFSMLVIVGCSNIPPERIFIAEKEIRGQLTDPNDFNQDLAMTEETCDEIRNDAAVRLRLAIKDYNLNDKIQQCADDIIKMINNNAIPPLDVNKAINREVTMRKCQSMIDVIAKRTWNKKLSAEESKFLLDALAKSLKQIGLPEIPKADENDAKLDELLKPNSIQGLICFLKGSIDCLKLYSLESFAEPQVKTEPQPIDPEDTAETTEKKDSSVEYTEGGEIKTGSIATDITPEVEDEKEDTEEKLQRILESSKDGSKTEEADERTEEEKEEDTEIISIDDSEG